MALDTMVRCQAARSPWRLGRDAAQWHAVAFGSGGCTMARCQGVGGREAAHGVGSTWDAALAVGSGVWVRGRVCELVRESVRESVRERERMRERVCERAWERVRERERER